MRDKKIYLILILAIILLLLISLFIKKSIDEGFQVRNGYDEACSELIMKRDFLKSYMGKLRMPIQDLSSTMVSARLAKKENMGFQNVWKDKCLSITDLETSNSSIAKACRALASVDKYELEVLPDIDKFYATVLYANQPRLDYVLKLLNFYTNLIQCRVPNESRATFDGSENIVVTDVSRNVFTVSRTNTIKISRDFGDLDTSRLALELEKLSPYYLSPDVVRLIIKFMISQETLEYLKTDSRDYINSNNTIMNRIQDFY
jgi:hypothetical protein